MLLGGGAAAFYFGYYANPSFVYKQSLGNTAIGYNRLVKYVEEQSKQNYKGYVGAGSYKFTSSSFNSEGKMAVKSDGSNGELTLDLGLGPTTLKADLMAITEAKSTTPDIYIKVDGLDGVAQLVGSPSLTPVLTKLNSSWIVIDHALINSLAQTSQTGSSNASPPTNAQILDEMRAFGKVNKEYLYSTDEDKAVLKLVKKYGIETVDGHKTYHYQVALSKDNVKKYITAQRDALKSSQLSSWLKKNGYDESVYAYFDLMKESANSIKATDTFDLWADMNQRIVYKVRSASSSNPASNYVDFGLDYKGGDKYPFFIMTKSKSGKDTVDAKFTALVDTKSSDVNFKFDFKSSGSDANALKADFKLKPSNEKVAITKPASAITLQQLMDQLGYGEIYKGYLQQLQQEAAAASAAKTSQ